MNDKNLREQLDGKKRPDLNRLAKDLKVKKVRDFKKDELINHLIEHFPAKDYYLKGNVHYIKDQPDYQQALEAYLEAARLEPGNTKYLNMVGWVYHILANFNKAIEYFEKALAINRKTYGERHPSVARDWNNLGTLWYSLGNYPKAIRYFQKALTIFEKMLGSQHPHTKLAKKNLAYAEKKRSGEK